MVDLLVGNPLLLLFLVAGIGYPLGQIRVGGVSLGVGAVLFVGLAVGAVHQDLRLPEIVYILGLVLFVYTVGLSSGPSFFESLHGRGLRDNALVAGLLILSGVFVALAARLLGFSAPLAAGLFAGSYTNTPALAGVLDLLHQGNAPAAALAQPTVAYSLAYPCGILGVLVAIQAVRRLLRVPAAPAGAANPTRFVVTTVRITSPDVPGRTVGDLLRTHEWSAVFGRVRRGSELLVATEALALQAGDLISIVAAPSDADRVVRALGERVPERIDLDRSRIDYRRVFVSNRAVAGRTLKELGLASRFGAVVTRVRRGDIEFLPADDMVVHLGDRLRVLTYRGNMDDVSQFLGDSYRALGEIDILTFSVGVLAGLLVGLLPVPLPGGLVFRLGLAGGPLLVALLLGKLGRTGPMVWTLPYNANMTLRQLGLILFLAGIGTRAGYSFVSYVVTREGLLIAAAGAAATTLSAVLVLVIGYAVLRIDFDTLTGMLAGFQTQPAVLAFAVEQSRNEHPNVGYATVYPTATIVKVLVAQALVALL